MLSYVSVGKERNGVILLVEIFFSHQSMAVEVQNL